MQGVTVHTAGSVQAQVKQEIAELRLKQEGAGLNRQTVLDKLLSGFVATARAEGREKVQADMEKMRKGAETQDELLTTENVSNDADPAGNDGSPLAQNDGSSIINEGAQDEAVNGDGNAGGVDESAVGTDLIYFESLDDFVNDPARLNKINPTNFYDYLRVNGYNPKPLSHGSTAGISFEQGGGFKINWGGDRILQYHPGGGVHVGSYWKVSSGGTETVKMPISGPYKP